MLEFVRIDIIFHFCSSHILKSTFFIWVDLNTLWFYSQLHSDVITTNYQIVQHNVQVPQWKLEVCYYRVYRKVHHTVRVMLWLSWDGRGSTYRIGIVQCLCSH